MKLLVTLDFPPEKGGIQRYLYGIVKFTYGTSDRVLAGCARLPVKECGDLNAAVLRYATPLSRVNKKISLCALILPYLKLCRAHRGAIRVECGNAYAALVPWLLKPIVHVPYTVYIHGTDLLSAKRLTIAGRMVRRALIGASGFMANSSFTAGLLRELGLGQPIEVQPPRIILPQHRTAAPGRDATCFRILAVGRLVEHKGHEVLIHAAALLPALCNWRLVIAGDGPLKKALVQTCRSLSVENRVTLVGALSDDQLDAEYRLASVFALSSLRTSSGMEGFGMVLLEAMARDLPVIGSATGGVCEVLDNGACGMLVEGGNREHLRAALEKLWLDPSAGASLAARARQRLMEYYVWK
jgi:phosphatidyl-myo-inositol dimannoside synthase